MPDSFRPIDAMVLLGGPSGSGKSSVLRALIQQYPQLYQRPQSFTTRPRRPAESDDEYAFVSVAVFDTMAGEGRFLNVDSVYGHSYAIAHESVRALHSRGIIPVKEVHPSRFSRLLASVPGAVPCVLLPDRTVSLAQVPTDRLTADAEYYTTYCIDEADVVLNTFDADTPADRAESLHRAVLTGIRFRSRFPRPGTIDRLNRMGYGRLASQFDDTRRPTTRNFHDLSRPFFEAAISRFSPDQRVLEVGSGGGWLRTSFDWPPVEYHAVDLSPEMLARLSPDSDSSLTAVTSVRALPFRTGTHHVVVASLADPFLYPEALCEIRRVLGPHGSLLGTVPASAWARALRPDSDRDKTTFTLEDSSTVEVYSFAFSPSELTELLLACGFSSVRVTPITGRSLPKEAPVSPALTGAAAAVGVPLNDLDLLLTFEATAGDSARAHS